MKRFIPEPLQPYLIEMTDRQENNKGTERYEETTGVKGQTNDQEVTEYQDNTTPLEGNIP